MTARRRIDVHQHLVPPRYAVWLRAKGVQDAGGRELAALDAAGHSAIDRGNAAALFGEDA